MATERTATHEIWSEEELNILREYYPSIGITVRDYLPGRSDSAIRGRAFILGLSYMGRSQRWTPEEDEIIRTYYPTHGRNIPDGLLSHKSKAAITLRASTLGVHKEGFVSPENVVPRRSWTPEEDAILREHYPLYGTNIPSSLLPERTKDSIQGRAVVHHLQRIKIRSLDDPWTPEEDAALLKYYPEYGAYIPYDLLNRTKVSVQERATQMRLRKVCAWWPEKDLDILREYYPTIGCRITDMLPNHSLSAIQKMASRLHIKSLRLISPNSRHTQKDTWTKEDDDILLEKYSTTPTRLLQEEYFPERSTSGINTRAKRLGLAKSNVWTDAETVILREHFSQM